MRRLGAIAVALSMVVSPATAQEIIFGRASNPASASPDQFGTRAAGMGFAYVGVAEGPSAMAYNAAGLAYAPGIQLGLYHQSQLLSGSLDSVAVAWPMGEWGLGLAVSNRLYSEMELRDSSGFSNGTAQPLETAFGFAVAKRVGQASLALQGAALRKDLTVSQYNFAGGQVGMLWKPVEAFQLGMAANWLLSVDGEPNGNWVGRLGGAYQWARAGLLSAGLELVPSGEFKTQLGFERSFFGSAALRAGYEASFPPTGAGNLAGLALGAGANVAGMQLDYAYRVLGDLGDQHQISIAYQFGEQQRGELEQSIASPVADNPAPGTLPAAPAADQPSAVTTEELDAILAEESPRFRVLSEGVAKGLDLEKQGLYKEASRSYRKAIEADRNDAPAWRALARLYAMHGYDDYARRCYGTLLRLDPENPEARSWLKSHPPTGR